MKKYIRPLVCGIAAGVAFLIVYLVGRNLAIGLLAGVAMLLVFYFVLREKPVQDVNMSYQLPELSAYAETGRKYLTQLVQLATQIQDSSAKASLEKVTSTGFSIIGASEPGTADVEVVRRMANYYLPSIDKIVRQYVEVTSSGLKTAEAQKFTKETVAFLQDLVPVFEQLLGVVHSDNMMDASAEMEVMKKVMPRQDFLQSVDLADQMEGAKHSEE